MLNSDVILIGGAPLVGKTVVGRKLAVRFEYGCLSADDLADGIIAVTNSQTHPHLHSLEFKDHRRYFMTHTVARMVTDARYRHEACWPALKSVIMKHAGGYEPLVIEGWGLLPDKVAQLDEAGIKSLWLTAEREGFEQRVRGQSEFFDETAMKDHFMRQFIERSVRYNDEIRQEAESNHLPVVEVALSAGVEDIVEMCMKVVE